jgi:TonB family protein
MRARKAKLAAFSLLAVVLGAGSSLRGQGASLRLEPVKVLSTVEAVYPPNTVSPGTVVLQVAIGTNGEIEGLEVVRAMPPFTEEALKAIRQWKFAPATIDGEPVRAVIPVAFSFSRPSVWWPQPNRPGSGGSP